MSAKKDGTIVDFLNPIQRLIPKERRLGAKGLIIMEQFPMGQSLEHMDLEGLGGTLAIPLVMVEEDEGKVVDEAEKGVGETAEWENEENIPINQ